MNFIKIINKLLPKRLQNNRGSISFDGIDDKLQKLSAISTSYPVTQYCRAKANVLGDYIYSQSNISSNTNYFFLRTDAGGFWRYVIRNNSGQATIDGGSADLNWHNIVTVSASSNDHKLYIDGVLVGSSTTNITFPSGLNRTQLAHWVRSSSSGFGNVNISEFAIWSSELTVDQIQLLNGNIKGTVLGIDPANLLSYNPLDDIAKSQSGDGVNFRDETGNNNTLLGTDGANNTGLISLGEVSMSYHSSIVIPTTDVFIEESENLQITDSILTTDTIIKQSENISIADSINIQNTTVEETESLEITDSILLTPTNTDAKNISKIVSINPLIFITDTNPVEIIKIDTTDPQNLTWVVQTIAGVDSAKDVTVNTSNDFIYIAGSQGRVIKVEIADLGNQTIINLNDSDDLLTIQANSNFSLIYAGTENNVGELYVLDERDTFLIDADFHALTSQQLLLDATFQTVDRFRLDSDFQVLAEQTFLLSSDFKCLTKPAVAPPPSVNRLDVIDPIKLTDFQVFIDDVELEDTDLILNSISISYSQGQESRASFQLARKHDQLNQTLKGVTSIITNQNNVKIKIRGVTEFDGQISELDCQYNNTEFIVVRSLSTEKQNQFNNITMSLPSTDSRLSLYDILIQNPKILNPVVDPGNEENPKKFKGIKVNLGTKIVQNNQRFFIFDSNGNHADEIQEGVFEPLQNWTYFWSPTVKKIENPVLNLPAIETDADKEIEEQLQKFDADQRELPLNERKPWLRNSIRIQQTLDRISSGIQDTLDTISKGINELAPLDSIRFFYIGTSLSPVSEDLWDLKQATHWRQAINPDKVTGKISLPNPAPGFIEVVQTDLPSSIGHDPGKIPVEYETFYKIGEAPFQEISVRNGIKETKSRLVDEQDGLYSIKDAEFDFRKYAKAVADLEYEKLKNINGDFLPDTSCSFNLTVDAYLYYGISLLTKINVDNTTEADIYNGNNGFPVSVKSITINSSDRKVSIQADNTKSTKELEEINSQFPDEDDPEYNTPASRTLIHLKSDMRTRLKVERTTVEREQRLE